VNRLARASGLSILLTVAAGPAAAQSPVADDGRFEVSVGALRIGRTSFGGRDAQETVGSGGTFRLFSSTTELTAPMGLSTRIGVRIIRRFDVEASGTYSTPELRTRVDSDAEISNAPLVAAVPVQQFTIGGAAVWYPPGPGLGSRTRFFVRGGMGLERHLENRGTRLVDGRMFEAGGGAKYSVFPRSRGWWKGIGVRGDAFALVRTSRITLDQRTHISPAFAASVYLRF
jgi:hypothetical protein